MASPRIGQSIYADLFPGPSNAEKRVTQIIEAAIKNYATIGIEKTTYERIAKACKISRPLIQHYFKDKDEIFEMVVKYIRAHYQQYVIEAMAGKSKARDLLNSYIESALRWPNEYPQYARTWFLFFYRCTIDKKYKALNTTLTSMGHERIQEILKLGADQKSFEIKELSRQAKLVQTIVTGAIVTEMTETLPMTSEEFRQITQKNCMLVLGAT